jgi:hypothetical protein
MCTGNLTGLCETLYNFNVIIIVETPQSKTTKNLTSRHFHDLFLNFRVETFVIDNY